MRDRRRACSHTWRSPDSPRRGAGVSLEAPGPPVTRVTRGPQLGHLNGADRDGQAEAGGVVPNGLCYAGCLTRRTASMPG